MRISVKASPAEREFFIKDDFTARDEERFFDVFVQIRSMTERCLTFNLSQCSFIDSAAMGMLVVACEEAAKRNVLRVIRSAPSEIREILLSAGFEKFYYFQ
ncbi:MAG: STAS domain-containing protein [Alphaproteobacteria bacterium]